MPRVAVVTDSTASLPSTMYEQYQIDIVPYYVHIKGKALRDTVDVTTGELCDYLTSLPDDAALPTTACPGPGDYRQAFIAAARRARDIVSIHMTSIGSGAYQAARLGREMALEHLRDARITVLDTQNVSMCQGWLSLQAARAALEDASLADVVELVQRLMPRARMFQTGDTLRYLYMGGRIGRAKHLLASLLSIRPIVSIEDGVIAAAAVARSRTASLQRITTLVEKAVGLGQRARIALTHAAAPEDAEDLRARLVQVIEPIEVLMCELSPALAVHSGPGTVGVCYLAEPS
ncbi:MAG TPA: DegV family protein [Chloroflexi bacterium]|jgi:DegV family protein with EDD domain|nr:DegV family protein [Chloroflexota bacterium]